jgi:cytoskeletal protein RodZ
VIVPAIRSGQNAAAATMFAIGASLREARLKRGLDMDAVQRALRIRRRYLEAMEDDRFDLIPGEVYARGFLREYAEFLGLDSSLYTEEYNARFATHDDMPMTAAPSAPRLHHGPSLPLILAVLAAIAVAIGLAAWQLGAGTAKKHPTPSTTVATVRKP